jgi:hypothetical protein
MANNMKSFIRFADNPKCLEKTVRRGGKHVGPSVHFNPLELHYRVYREIARRKLSTSLRDHRPIPNSVLSGVFGGCETSSVSGPFGIEVLC